MELHLLAMEFHEESAGTQSGPPAISLPEDRDRDDSVHLTPADDDGKPDADSGNASMRTDENCTTPKVTAITGTPELGPLDVLAFPDDTNAGDQLVLDKKRKSTGQGVDSERAGPKKMKLAEDYATHLGQFPILTDSSLARDKSLLPAEIWHYIFTFCPAKLLGNLLRVNKLFNLYLDPFSSVRREVPVSVNRGSLGPLKPNAIWQASRRFFWPHMPAPLRTKTELDMWRLACSRRCETCGKLDSRDHATPPPNPWRPGPGAESVVVVWPYGKRMCASCLVQGSIKELDVLLSPSIPSAIVSALPSVFLTPDLDVFFASTLKQGQRLADFEVTKLFSAPDVKDLELEFQVVKDMGPGTVDEWLKGLSGRGKELRHEASKWEKWDGSGGVTRMCTQLYPGYMEETSVLPAPTHSTGAIPPPSASLPSLPPPGTSQISSQPRHERTMEEVAELKASRKAEIERRAALLDPPLAADVLHHIPSFQAATHIITPLDDNAWDLLKPRLLAQRVDAEEQENEQSAHTKVSQEEAVHRHLEATLATTKEARDLIDKDWEMVQAPLRARISHLADEIVRDKWDKGKRVSKQNCSKFAVDVLVYIREKFYAGVAKDGAAAKAFGQDPTVDPPDGPFTQKLTLENMKWIFDTKIKPFTELYRKEIFYCNGCEWNSKAFGFEGVIQHYAAKHTTALSVGSVVVHWRAEWPRTPPFAREARAANRPLFTPGFSPFTNNPASLQDGYNYPPTSGTPMHPSYPLPSGFACGAAPSVDHYHHQAPPPPSYQFQGAVHPYPPQTSYGQQSYTAHPTQYQPYPAAPGPYNPPGIDPMHGYGPPPDAGYHGSYQANAQVAYTAPPPPAFPQPLYQTKLDDIARNSREIWQTLANIKDLPGAVRVFVTIHHLAKRYWSTFGEKPPLSLFIDGLSNNKDMRPVRNINGLACKTCHQGLGDTASVEKDGRTFSLPQLVNHFQSEHAQPVQHNQVQETVSVVDWVVDMVLLPNPVVMTQIQSSINKAQRKILLDALPDAFEPRPIAATELRHPQSTPNQHQPGYSGAMLSHSGDDRSARDVKLLRERSTNEHITEDNIPNSYPFGDHFYTTQPHTIPASHSVIHDAVGGSSAPRSVSVTEHGQIGRAEGGHQSSLGSRTTREQRKSQNHKNVANKSKRGKMRKAGSADGRAIKQLAKESEEDARREERKIRAIWAAERVETARAYSSANPVQNKKEEKASAPQSTPQSDTRPSQHSERLASQRPPALPRPLEESNLTSALEMHLDQQYSPAIAARQRAPNTVIRLDDRASVMPLNTRYISRTATQYEDNLDRSRSPVNGGRRSHAAQEEWADRPHAAHQIQSRPQPQPQPVSLFQPGPTERCVADRDGYPLQPELYEQLPRRVEGRLSGQTHRLDNVSDDIARRPEYYRYVENARAPSRQAPVETWEIVHVIDERGEYYIRRPVRREPDPIYAYEERRVHRDAGPYTAYEPVYVPASRADLAREHLGPMVDRREDPSYYEEYDPRFPAA